MSPLQLEKYATIMIGEGRLACWLICYLRAFVRTQQPQNKSRSKRTQNYCMRQKKEIENVPVDESLGDGILHLLDGCIGGCKGVPVQDHAYGNLAVRVGLARVHAAQDDVTVVARQQRSEQEQQRGVHANRAQGGQRDDDDHHGEHQVDRGGAVVGQRHRHVCDHVHGG
jgi:hypothetical protein